LPASPLLRAMMLDVVGPLGGIALADGIELRALIGRGSGGEVYAAFDARAQRHVAVKILTRDDVDAIARFLREAEMQARLSHPHICAILGGGRLADGRLFLALELLDEGTLSEAAERLPLAERVRLVREAALGLHAAHAQGLIHRDVKPANILLGRHADRRLRACIADFGAARAFDRSIMSVSGIGIGTPEYMAPEQMDGAADRRTDVYGLGATLFRLVTGRAPYAGSTAEVLLAVRRAGPPRVRDIEPEAPAALQTIIGRAMEREPRDRYENALALADDLRLWLEGGAIRARPPTLLQRGRRWMKRNRLLLGAAGAIALAGAGGLGAARLIDRRQSRQIRQGQYYVREVARLGESLREASMRSLHAVAGDRLQVSRQLDAIAAALPSLDGGARTMARLALGRGWLALGAPVLALPPLEAAHHDNPGDADVSFALGQALGERYREALDEADGMDDADERAAARLDAAARYRDRALPLLAVHRPSALESGELTQAQIAFYEGRLDEADRRAAQVAVAEPWLFEATRLRGDIHARRGVELREAGRIAEAETAFARAIAFYDDVLARAASDPAAQASACSVWGSTLRTRYDQSRLAPDSFTAARRRCAEANTVLPSANAVLASVEVDGVQARFADEHGDPKLAAERLDEAAALLRASPDLRRPRLQQALAMALLERAIGREHRGEDGSAGFDEALAIAREQSPQQSMMRELTRDLSNAATMRLDRGADGSRLTDLAVQIAERAVAQAPGRWVAYNALGNACSARGQVAARVGGDPVADWARATAAYHAVEKLNPATDYGYYNACTTNLYASAYFLDLGRPERAPIDDAESDCRAAIAVDANYAQSHFGLASASLLRARRELGHAAAFDAALAHAAVELEAARKIDPRSELYALSTFEAARLRVEAALSAHRDPRAALADAERALALARQVGTGELDARTLELSRWQAEAALARHAPVQPFVAAGRAAFARVRVAFPGDARSIVEAAALELVAAEAGGAGGDASAATAWRLLDEAMAHDANLAGLVAPLRRRLASR
jgi:eukaryotic-like serine/threonine-protein kinase